MITRIIFFIFQIIAGLSSIASVLFFVFSNEKNTKIALVLLCICLLSICISLIIGIFIYVKNNNPAEYLIDSVFAKMEFYGPTNGSYECFKTFQNKTVFMSSIVQQLYWTGTGIKNVKSSLPYDIQHIIKPNNLHEFIHKFRKPLFYNQIATIHLALDFEDAQNTYKPWLYMDIKQPTNFVYFSIVLKYKPDNYSAPAIITKSPLEAPAIKESIHSVPFDLKTKSYSYRFQPEMGYSYAIEWEK